MNFGGIGNYPKNSFSCCRISTTVVGVMKLISDLPAFYSTAVQSGFNKKRLSAIPESDSETVELIRKRGYTAAVLDWISSLFLRIPHDAFPTHWLRLLLMIGAYEPVTSIYEATHVYVLYREEVRSLPVQLSTNSGLIFFDYQFVRYIESDGRFVRLAPTKFVKENALSVTEVEKRRLIYGDPSYSNNLTLSSMAALLAVVKEQVLLSPMTYFLIFCVSMWTITKYVTYTVLIIILVIVERSVAIRQSVQTWSHLNSISSNVDDQLLIVVRREIDGLERKETLRAREVVPGDHIMIKPGMNIPCDCVLIKGEVIADISFVTGESKAVRSNAVPPGNNVRASSVASALLLCGSKALRTRAPGGSLECRAVVVANGFHTLQGNFLLSVLFRDPSPAERRLEYWLVQAVAGLLGLAAISMMYTYWASTSILGLNPVEITVRVFDLLTDALPPALPLSLSIAALAASFRLPLYISSSRSGRPTHLLAGLVNKVVLDKTNTVTTTEMSVTGVVEAESLSVASSPLKGSDLELAMASCNYLAIVDGKVLGDPLEVALMESVGWEIDTADESFIFRKSGPASSSRQVDVLSPSLDQSPPRNTDRLNEWLELQRAGTSSLQIVASFPFNPITMRMSVVAKIGDKLWGFSKGAYEQIVAKCDPNTVPFSFPETYDRLSSLGYRILAYSCRSFPSGTSPETVLRDDVETEMRFCGIVLVSNQLHPSSKDGIRSLRENNIQVFLCTGDSSGTAIAVARQAGITGPVASSPPDSRKNSFMYEPLLERGSTSSDQLVLSRLTPDDKALFVEALAEKERIGAVMMCGDGPNDANALCAADVGVVVNASPNPLLESAAGCMACLDPVVGLQAVVEIITLGRSALATLLCIAEIVISYAVVEGTCVVICYSVGDNLTDFQYAVVDMFIVLPTVLLLAIASKPASKIKDTRNIPPFKVKTIGLAFQCTACAVMQFIALEVLKAQEWYVPFKPSSPMMAGAQEWIHSTADLTGLENTVLFILCCFQSVLLIHVFTIRTLNSWCTSLNRTPVIQLWLRFLSIIIIVQLGATTALQGTAFGQAVMEQMDLVPLQGTFIFQLVILMSAQILVSTVWEFGVMPRLEREVVLNYHK